MFAKNIFLWSAANWNPGRISGLYAWWDAERSDTITTVSGGVSAWADIVASLTVTQSVSSTRPAYSTTSYNGRPGITFDGVDDVLEVTSAGSLPAGSTAAEAWLLVDQQAADADATVRIGFTMGSASNNNMRRLGRNQGGGVSRAASLNGTGAAVVTATNTGNFNNRHVARYVSDGTNDRVDVDASAGSNAADVPSTSGARTRIGAGGASAAASFFQGALNSVLVTPLLSASDASNLYSFLNRRK